MFLKQRQEIVVKRSESSCWEVERQEIVAGGAVAVHGHPQCRSSIVGNGEMSIRCGAGEQTSGNSGNSGNSDGDIPRRRLYEEEGGEFKVQPDQIVAD